MLPKILSKIQVCFQRATREPASLIHPFGIRMRPMLVLGILLIIGIPAATEAMARSDSGKDLEGLQGGGSSTIEIIFHEAFPELKVGDAPTILNGQGITCRYAVAELPSRDDRTWNLAGKSHTRRAETEQLRRLPTIANARELLDLSGLDMRDIQDYRKLVENGDRDQLIALLTRYIEPNMDKYNKMAVEGYDPVLCINEARDYVFKLEISESELDHIRGTYSLFYAGRYEEFRNKMEAYLGSYPDLSYIHVAIGNAYFAEGDLDHARQWYRRGASANPLNPMLGYSMAFCHLAEGNVSGAIEALIGSIVVCRNNLLAWMALNCLLPEQGGRIMDRRFKNRTYVEADQAQIWLDKSIPERLHDPWLYYAAAEIATKHPRCATWYGFDHWDLEAIEYYKVAHLLGVYLVLKRRDAGLHDPYLSGLESIYRAGYLRQYVLFDKIAPYAQYYRTSTLPPREKAKLREYIDKFVVLRGGPTMPH